MGSTGGGRRDFLGLEQRRQHAAELFAGGEIMAKVARLLQVSRQSASRWYAQWKKGGVDSLRATERAGRPPKLSTTQREPTDGLSGLMPKKRGPRGGHKVTAEVLALIDDRRARDQSLRAAALARLVRERFGVTIHPRSIERAMARREKQRR